MAWNPSINFSLREDETTLGSLIVDNSVLTMLTDELIRIKNGQSTDVRRLNQILNVGVFTDEEFDILHQEMQIVKKDIKEFKSIMRDMKVSSLHHWIDRLDDSINYATGSKSWCKHLKDKTICAAQLYELLLQNGHVFPERERSIYENRYRKVITATTNAERMEVIANNELVSNVTIGDRSAIDSYIKMSFANGNSLELGGRSVDNLSDFASIIACMSAGGSNLIDEENAIDSEQEEVFAPNPNKDLRYAEDYIKVRKRDVIEKCKELLSNGNAVYGSYMHINKMYDWYSNFVYILRQQEGKDIDEVEESDFSKDDFERFMSILLEGKVGREYSIEKDVWNFLSAQDKSSKYVSICEKALLFLVDNILVKTDSSTSKELSDLLINEIVGAKDVLYSKNNSGEYDVRRELNYLMKLIASYNKNSEIKYKPCISTELYARLDKEGLIPNINWYGADIPEEDKFQYKVGDFVTTEILVNMCAHVNDIGDFGLKNEVDNRLKELVHRTFKAAEIECSPEELANFHESVLACYRSKAFRDSIDKCMVMFNHDDIAVFKDAGYIFPVHNEVVWK